MKTVSSSWISCSVVILDVRCARFLRPLRLARFNPVHLERLGSLPEDTVRFYVAEIASALAFLHEHRIMHRYV